MSAPPEASHGATSQAAALALTALIMLVPAYVLPVMHLGMLGMPAKDTTIFSGVIQLWQENLGILAVIVFTASFVVPILKLAGLAWLLLAAGRQTVRHPRRLARVYGVIDAIGRWSMLDVFLVAFLSGAVRFGVLAEVQPRPGIIAFGAVVVLTMLATRRFDPRVFWVNPTPSGNAATVTPS